MTTLFLSATSQTRRGESEFRKEHKRGRTSILLAESTDIEDDFIGSTRDRNCNGRHTATPLRWTSGARLHNAQINEYIRLSSTAELRGPAEERKAWKQNKPIILGSSFRSLVSVG